MKYADMTDQQLRCAWKHGWTAKTYLGHGISDRAQASRTRLRQELVARGMDDLAGGWWENMQWGQHDGECPVPTDRPE